MKLSMNQWLMLGVGAVVLYFIWKRYGSTETKLGAFGGREDCICHGENLGKMSVKKCQQLCDRAIDIKTEW